MEKSKILVDEISSRVTEAVTENLQNLQIEKEKPITVKECAEFLSGDCKIVWDYY